ncbi:tRNA (adenosine(37)-N6)-dimethylallyltransferase MiaA [Pseudomethylobacillus aquaticus]|uniref:tRNA dimethylallyltransferase n=1 Tax=Pseudomethylobacillus aquaticus TaxID=2676064 RepID=A0A3N0V6L8_9PROT|nr:tRNA (adenosine(37)-N6)-dimethylallyltransferase MiaA [Pseudomethylobacillus aquaticus]ROH88018.1 tRNA (adenosine(37)-N6)-dimethylallyltransferase MiaA [Pseudomethylobacillus aquaticus]
MSLLTPVILPRAIFLMGPTASGKTGAVVELAQRLPVELISVDSALVYRDMDIGTAKPDAATLALAPHHLIDLISPLQSYSAAQFRSDALALMADITARGRIPLLVGGTMLYFNALQQGLGELPQADAAVRAQLDAEALQTGWPAMHARLAVIDPDTAARLMPTDAQRIQRAFEVWMLSGKTMTQLFAEQQNQALPYRLLKLALMPSDRSVLHQRIALRFGQMLQAGLLDEVQQLRQRYPDLQPELPSMRCVGYRQAWQYLQGEFDMNELRDKGIAATRQLAKRQLTWLRGMDDTVPVDCLDPALTDRLQTTITNWLG